MRRGGAAVTTRRPGFAGSRRRCRAVDRPGVPPPAARCCPTGRLALAARPSAGLTGGSSSADPRPVDPRTSRRHSGCSDAPRRTAARPERWRRSPGRRPGRRSSAWTLSDALGLTCRCYATRRRCRPHRGCERALPRSSPRARSPALPSPWLPRPSPPRHGRVLSPAPFSWPGGPSTLPGQGGWALSDGGVIGGSGGNVGSGRSVGLGRGVTTGPGVGGGVGAVGAVGAAVVVGTTGRAVGAGVGGPTVSPGVGPGVWPGPAVGVGPGGPEPSGPPVGGGDPLATGPAVTAGVAVAPATWFGSSSDPARPNATAARTRLTAPSARARRVRCGPVTDNTGSLVRPPEGGRGHPDRSRPAGSAPARGRMLRSVERHPAVSRAAPGGQSRAASWSTS